MPRSDVRLRRSLLFMPGSNLRALEKARTLPADVIVFDLEDSVAPEQKSEARSNALAAVQSGNYGSRELIVRVNHLATHWGAEDLRATAATGVAGIMLPKVETAATLREVREVLTVAGAPVDLPLWIMVETARGVLNLGTIVGGDDALGPIVMGTTDLANELGVSASGERSGLRTALSQCVLTAAAHRLDIIDGVFLDFCDEPGFAAACRQGRELGFTGKSLIHPSQIVEANRCFGISEAAAERARKVLDAWQAARDEGSGVAVLEGQLIESMHVDSARRTLALYKSATNQ